MKLKRTGAIIPFLDVGVGCAYFAHGKVWVRTDYAVGVELMGSQWTSGSACNFLIDGTMKSERQDRLSEPVEAVEWITA